MAKLKGPFLSIDAFGHIGKTFAVSHWKGIKKGMKHFTPRNPRTVLQQDNRSIMRYAVWSWQTLTDEQKWSYDQSAKNLKLKMSGYNYFLQTYIAAYKEAPPPPPPPGYILDGLVGWWKMDENEGIIIYDETANHRDGIVVDANWVPGKDGSALDYNGTDEYAYISHGDDPCPWKPTAALTYCAWVYNRTTANQKHLLILDYRADGSWASPYFVIFMTTGLSGQGHFSAGLCIDGTKKEYWDIWLMPQDTWSFICITYDGSYMRPYANGQPVGTPQNWPGSVDYGTSKELTLATSSLYWTGRNFWNGIIDELAIYNRALSPAEIQQNYEVFL